MKRLLAIFLALCLIASAVPFASAKEEEKENTSEYVANEVIIMQKSDSARALPLKEAEVIETSAIEECAGGEDVDIIKGTVAYGTDIENLCDKLEKRDDILSADPNYISQTSQITIPSEAQKTGSDYNAFNWYKNSLRLCEAWQSADTLGSEDIVVGVIDTGVNSSHKELENNMWDDGEGNCGYNAYGENYDTSDTNGHGSNVAGIIAMQANDFGYVGIAPEVKIMALKASSTSSFTDDDILECLNYAIEHGADVINMSFSTSSISETMAYAYQSAATKAVLVAAAGNHSYDCASTPEYPAAYAGVLGVMAYGSYNDSDRTNYNIDNGELSSFSNYDDTGLYYQIAAPGVDIAGPSCKNDSDFTFYCGTSQASPIVAGTAALYLSLYPNSNSYQVRQEIINNADKEISGYYSDATYRKLNISATLGQNPVADNEVNLSATAKEIVKSALGLNTDIIHQSDLDALSIISETCLSGTENFGDALKELTGVQILYLNEMNLKNADLDFLKDASFYRLYSLDISNNKDISDIAFSENLPVLRVLGAVNCSLADSSIFMPLKSLYKLYASGNKFITSAPLKELGELRNADFSECKLQDCIGFKNLENLETLNVSYNYITDISPLHTYNGAVLDVSANPLSLGNSKNYSIKSIKDFMSDNGYSYYSIKFNCDYPNGDFETDYIQAKSLKLKYIEVPRCTEKATLSLETNPESANVNSYALFSSDDTSVKVNPYTGDITWNKTDINYSKEIKITVSPTSGFPEFDGTIKISVPEVIEFNYSDGTYILKANTATNSVKIGNTEIFSYRTINGYRYFNVPNSVIYSENLVAVPYDQFGAGKEFAVNTPTSDKIQKAEIKQFCSEKEEYLTGESAKVYILANDSANQVKIKDCKNKNEFFITSFVQTDEGRLFYFEEQLNSSYKRKFKAYASSDGTYSLGAKVLTFTVSQRAESLKLSLGENGALYFADNKDSADILSSFYPSNCSEKLEFVSSNPEIASVDSSGKVSANAYGATVITATSESGLEEDLPVLVSPPKMNDIDYTIGNKGEQSTFEVDTFAANDIVLKNADGSDVDFEYTLSSFESNIAGFDTHWIITATITSSEKQNIKFYAVDNKGLNSYTNSRKISFTCPAALEDFEIVCDGDTFNRNDGKVILNISRTPEDASQRISWSLSSNKVANLRGYANYAVITPKKSGTLTVYASANGIKKEKVLTFYGGRIVDAESEKENVSAFEPFNVSVKTTKDVEYVHLYDTANQYGAEYSDSHYYEDIGEYRYWTLPYFFYAPGEELRVWGGDSVTNLDEAVYLDINAVACAHSVAPDPVFIEGNAGDSEYLSLVNTADLEEITSGVSITSENERIAKYQNGKVKLLSKGETNLICTYGEYSFTVPVKVFAPIKEITFDTDEYMLEPGESVTLSPTFTPADYTDSFYYYSTDENVARVDENGKVTAENTGSALIYAVSDGGVRAFVTITVHNNEQITSLAFEKDEYEVEVGQTLTPKMITNVEDYSSYITFNSSNTRILDIEGDTFTALQEGAVTITAVSDNGLSCQATVKVSADREFSLSRTYMEVSLHSLFDISLNVNPEGVDTDGFWFTDNRQVAVVSQSGMVYAKSAGYCNIYFLSDNGEIDYCTLKVNSVNINSVSLESDSLNLEVHQNEIIEYSISPSWADERPIFTSADSNIAAVDENGIVTAVSKGKTYIFLSLKNGTSIPISVSVSENNCTIVGETEKDGAVTAVLKDLCGNERRVLLDEEFEIASLNHSTYTVTLSAVHHTPLIIEDVNIYEITDLGKIKLPNGDANGDGVIDISDISLLLSNGVYMSDASQTSEWYDINDDGVINIKDISVILLAENYAESEKTIIY